MIIYRHILKNELNIKYAKSNNPILTRSNVNHSDSTLWFFFNDDSVVAELSYSVRYSVWVSLRKIVFFLEKSRHKKQCRYKIEMKYSSIRHIRLRHIRQSAIYDMEPSVPRIFLSLPCIFIRHIRHPVYTTFAIYDIFFDPLGLIVLYISSGIYDISCLTKAEKIIFKNKWAKLFD